MKDEGAGAQTLVGGATLFLRMWSGRGEWRSSSASASVRTYETEDSVPTVVTSPPKQAQAA
eukprot:scaffold4043_cov110-Skeletonema_marinoi.AAC.1